MFQSICVIGNDLIRREGICMRVGVPLIHSHMDFNTTTASSLIQVCSSSTNERCVLIALFSCAFSVYLHDVTHVRTCKRSNDEE